MKKILFILLVGMMAVHATAQPAKRKAEQKAAATTSGAISPRAQISFPVQTRMAEDVVWRRDIYRELDLHDDANASLYYPVEPMGNQVNLFTYIFKLMMTGNIKAYEYRLDGNEVFNEAAQVKLKAFLDNYHIFYEKTNRGIYIDNSDIPSREVTAYYLKECVYYDQTTASFHTQVLALCPIMKREDDFGDNATSYPLFWVKYDDLAPFLVKQTVMTSNLNNAAVMSMDDYFAKNMYRGKIYKTNNMLGKTLAQYCPTDSALSKEQKRIEKQIADFEEGVWGHMSHEDSIRAAREDSIQAANKPARERKASARQAAGSGRRSSATKAPRQKSSGGSGSSGAARVSVRRQRR